MRPGTGGAMTAAGSSVCAGSSDIGIVIGSDTTGALVRSLFGLRVDGKVTATGSCSGV
ncbi:hypothetical protein D3C85_1115440 [compost metagenome]